MTSRLKRSIHNQLDITASPLQPRKGGGEHPNSNGDPCCKELALRKFDLVPVIQDVLVQCKSHEKYITKLDISFSIANLHILNLLCTPLCNLRTLHAKSCGLSNTTLIEVLWPRKLQDLDLSRNELSECPQGITELIYLGKLNLSGNKIEFIPPAVLQLPCLKRCLFLNNPIHNIPKGICREGVERMRRYLAVEPLPFPQDAKVETDGNGKRRRRASNASVSSLENCSDLRRYVLGNQSSFESDYESNQRCHSLSTSSVSSASTDVEYSECSDIEFDSNSSKIEWRAFDSDEIPDNYIKTDSNSLCNVYLPDDCAAKVEIHEVKDLSLHPRLKDNELLITPVVRITPHGLNFGPKPAIVVLSHCTKRNRTQAMNLHPMCSSTQQFQATKWVGINSECEIFAERVMFKTFHFSLFAVVATFPYPSLSVDVRPGVGGDLVIPELPGFSLHIPNESVRTLSERVSIKGTVYYCDDLYRANGDGAPASACIGIEPHGMEFDSPVEITIPIPDFTDIKAHFPGAKLELWCSQQCTSDGNAPCNWKQVEEINIHLENSEDRDSAQVLRFSTRHFSWYEVLWSMCTSPLQKLRLGAACVYDQLLSRAKYIAVRFQAFMSHPHGKCCTFGLAVTVYKFGEPLAVPSNYPLLVADSGAKRMFLRTGELHVRVEGCFTASQDVGENLERSGRVMDFTGEDFCERFEFALSLKKDTMLPLQEGQVLGKLRFIQWEESNPIHKSYNLMMPSSSLQASTQTKLSTVSPHPAMNVEGFQTLADFTPPRSPEPDLQLANQITPSRSSDNSWLRKRAREDSPTLPDCTPKRQALMRNSDITDKVLMSVSQKCGCKFMELGISLGLDYETITNRISRLEGRKAEHLKAFEMLQEWKARGASYEVLARALQEIGLNGVALKVCYTRD